MAKFLSNINLETAHDIQFKNAAGTNTGKIESDGNNLVLSNAVGDILLGDGASDVYIGDGTNNVDILFEQSGNIMADASSSGVTITLGSSNTTLAFGGSTSFADIVSAFSSTGTNTVDIGTNAKPFKDIYAAHHVGGNSINYATSRGWVEDPAPLSETQVGYFGGNFSRNGDAAENEVVWGIDPFDNKALLWKAIGNTSDDDDDGGWNKEITIPANNNIGYLSYVYFKADFTPDSDGDGQVYLGCGTTSGQTINISDDSSNTNPYFVSRRLDQANNNGAVIANRWYLMVGVIQAYNNETTDTNTLSGIYDVETGEKVYEGAEFKMGNNTTGQKHRAYLYYQDSGSAGNVYFWNPGFHAIDGSEPKIQDLVKRQTIADTLKVGRDKDNYIDFTTDNQVNFRVNASTELALDASSLSPGANNGLTLGTTSNAWADLFLYAGGVINFNNGDVTLTHQVSNNLVLAGGHLEFSGYGFVMDGNTITGIDDSGEFTDDDNHIMTSAAINDKFLALSGGTVTGDTTFTADVFVHHDDGLQIGDTGNNSTARTTLTSFNSGGNSRMKIKGGNFYHDVAFETSWNDFEYAELVSSYNTSDTTFKLKKSASDGSTAATTTISTGSSTFAGSVACTTLAPSSHIYLGATKHLYLDGGGNTSIRESSADTIQLTAGGSVRQTITTSKTTFAGEIEGDSLDINGDADISGNVTLSGDNPTITLNDSNGRAAAIDVVGNTFRIDDVANNAAIFTADLSTNPVQTTFGGTINSGSITTTGHLQVSSSYPRIYLTDTDSNDDYSIINNNGTFIIYNDTDSSIPLAISGGNGTTLSGTLTVGADDTGHDVIFYGATSGKKMQWDESADTLIVDGALDINGAADISGNLVVGGDLTINGTTVTVDTTNLNVQDKNITLNYSSGDSSASADGAGITIQDAVNSSTDATILWDATNDEFDFSHGATFADDVKVAALKKLYFDGGGDTYIVENASNNLQFVVGGNEKLVLGNSSATIKSHLKWTDNYQIQLGTDADLQWLHTGTHMYMDNKTGDMVFRQKKENADIIFQGNDAGGNDTSVNITALTLDMSENGNATFSGNVTVTGGTLNLGNDVSLYDDGTNILRTDDIFHANGNIHVGADGKLFDRADTSNYIELASTINISTNTSITGTLATSGNITTTASNATISAAESGGATTKIMGASVGRVGTSSNHNLEILSNNTAAITIDTSQNATFAGNLDFGSSGRDILFGDNLGAALEFKEGSNLYMRFVTTNGSEGIDLGSYPIRSNLTVGVDDTGHDVKFFGATASHYMMWDESKDLLQVAGDLEIKNANGSNPADAGSLYFNESGTIWGTNMYGFRINLDGSANNLQIQSHDTSTERTIISMQRDTAAVTFSGSLTIPDYIYHAGDANAYFGFEYDDAFRIVVGGGEKIHVTTSRIRFNEDLLLLDSHKLNIGSDNDLQIFHDGNNSYIDNITGHLKIRNFADDSDIIFVSDDGTGGTATYFSLDGSIAGGDGAGTLFTIWPDNSRIGLGGNADLRMYHDGTDSKIINLEGNLQISQYVDDGDIIFSSDNGSGGVTAYLTLDGGITSILAYKDILMANDGNNGKIKFGASQDLQIYHDGSHSFVSAENGAGSLYIRPGVGDTVQIEDRNSNDMIVGAGGGAVSLYYAASKKFETASAGVKTAYGKTSSTDGDAVGDIVYFGGTTSMEVGEIYYLTSSGTWALADADAESTAKGMLAVALGGSSDTDGMLVRGFVTLDHDPGTVGDTLFLSTTAGLATSTAPSGNGDIIRVIGYCLDSTNGQIYFNPDGTFVEVSA